MKIKESSYANENHLNSELSIIIGVSINNSYFKEENIKKLLNWSMTQAQHIYAMIPDEPAVHTLMALGNTEKKAKDEARKKSNALRNKFVKAVEDLKHEVSFKIIRWEDISQNIFYLEALDKIKMSYNTNVDFRCAMRATTTNVLISNGLLEPNDEQIEIGVQFLFKELAFITHSNLILEEQAMAYVYHKTMIIMKDIIAGKYDFRPNKGVGFITTE